MIYNVKLIDYKDSVQLRVYKKSIVTNKNKGNDKNSAIEESEVRNFETVSDEEFEELLNSCFCDNKNKEEFNLASEQVKKEEEAKEQHSLRVSTNRTINEIYAIARANTWEYFVTLTIDPKKLDRTDYNLVLDKIKIWVNNIKKRYAPNLKYLIVPELHKDKKSWHFHALFASIGNLPLEFSGKTCIGSTVFNYIDRPKADKIYNLPLWDYGFSTVTKIKSSKRTISYIGKYITKDVGYALKNRHRFLASHNLERAKETIYNVPFAALDEFIDKHKESVDYIKKVLTDNGEVLYMEFNKDKEGENVIFRQMVNEFESETTNEVL